MEPVGPSKSAWGLGQKQANSACIPPPDTARAAVGRYIRVAHLTRCS